MSDMPSTSRRNPTPIRYFCHRCNKEFFTWSANYRCPFCLGHFVEELSETLGILGDRQGLNSVDQLRIYLEMDWSRLHGGDNENVTTATAPAPNDDNVAGPSGSRGSGDSTGDANVAATSTEIDNDTEGAVGGETGPASDRRDADEEHGRRYSLVDLILGLSHDYRSQGHAMNFINDFAWGLGGLDDMVGRLVTQIHADPPPLSKEKIDAIPTVTISAKDVEEHRDCAVCWNDFRMVESVRQLPCKHMYHTACIVPWLQLHGTCPICRYSFAEKENKSSARNSVASRVRNSAASSARNCAASSAPNSAASSVRNSAASSAAANNRETAEEAENAEIENTETVAAANYEDVD